MPIARVLSMADSSDLTTAAPGAASTEPLTTGALTKAVIPAAGLGTRFLPATKATPKEMLPVTRRGKPSIEDHFDRAHELEEALTAKGDKDGLALVRASNEMASMHYV